MSLLAPAVRGAEGDKPEGQTSAPVLKGTVSEVVTPFKEDGSTETVPAGKAVSLTMHANINSELSNIGDDVVAMVSIDQSDKKGTVVLPGQWQMRGKVARVENRKRGGRDGYIEIKFDKLVSPDGKYEVPVDAVVSTKDSTAKAVAKHVVKDSAYVSVGAVGGALASVQLTGIPLAVATNGYSVAIGAGVGATLGLVAAARRQGKILSVVPGDELKFKLEKPLILPAFNAEALPSAAPPAKLDNFDIKVLKSQFRPDPFGDKLSRLLTVRFHFDNKTDKEYGVDTVAVISDHNQVSPPYALVTDLKERSKRVKPGTSCDAELTFSVASNKHKYRLILLDRGFSHILSEVPIN